MKLELSSPFSWSICIVATGMAGALNLAAVESLYVHLSVEWMLACMLFISVYATVAARQAYVHARKWPKILIVILFPLSFLHLIFDAPIGLNIGITIFNLLLWGVAYRLTGKLIRLSLKNTLNLS